MSEIDLDRYPIPQDVSLAPVIRALYECTREVERVTTRHIESLGLTPSQFDVLAVLGDSEGMTCKELGARALITGGTLTPVLDRLNVKGLIARARGQQDSRQTIVSLTAEGQALYEATFLPHIRFLRGHTDQLAPGDRDELVVLLKRLKELFQ